MDGDREGRASPPISMTPGACAVTGCLQVPWRALAASPPEGTERETGHAGAAAIAISAIPGRVDGSGAESATGASRKVSTLSGTTRLTRPTSN
eukprot:16443966-Heterocapsa_arctica.AAC.1